MENTQAPQSDQDALKPRPIPPSVADEDEEGEEASFKDGDTRSQSSSDASKPDAPSAFDAELDTETDAETEAKKTHKEERATGEEEVVLYDARGNSALDAEDSGTREQMKATMTRKFGSVNSFMSEMSEDDPRQVGMDNGIFGDFDMKRSPSTKDFVLSYIDDEMGRRNLPGRISVVANESLSARRGRRSSTIPTIQGVGESSCKHVKFDGEINRNLLNRPRPDVQIALEYEKEGSRREVPPAMAQEVLSVTGELFMEGIESIVDDNFWKCFQSRKPQPWNWNAYLWPIWVAGVVFRYFFLFPIRLVIFALGWLLFGIGMLSAQTLIKKGPRRTSIEHGLISMMCGVFCITWGAVIRYHGAPVKVKPGECQPVYVANHTSMIDVIILQQMRCFSLVGQRHKGIVRFLQEVVLGCLQCVWFDRGEIKDRAAVAQKLNEHANDPTRNPLLVFPEGTCVNNEYVIQFKKGIFEIGAPVVPVAIKYNKMFVDPFWNSRAQSFPMHLVELMTSWCLICDVWYMQPYTRKQDESAEAFAGRVKKAIAEKANLINVNWDGYMKYWKPSERYLHARQASMAKTLRKIHKKRMMLDESRKQSPLVFDDLVVNMKNGEAEGLRKRHTVESSMK